MSTLGAMVFGNESEIHCLNELMGRLDTESKPAVSKQVNDETAVTAHEVATLSREAKKPQETSQKETGGEPKKMKVKLTVNRVLQDKVWKAIQDPFLGIVVTDKQLLAFCRQNEVADYWLSQTNAERKDMVGVIKRYVSWQNAITMRGGHRPMEQLLNLAPGEYHGEFVDDNKKVWGTLVVKVDSSRRVTLIKATGAYKDLNDWESKNLSVPGSSLKFGIFKTERKLNPVRMTAVNKLLSYLLLLVKNHQKRADLS